MTDTTLIERSSYIGVSRRPLSDLLSVSKADAMAFFHIYFDESGIHDGSTTCVVAGGIAERWQWEGFETGWVEILNDDNVSLFHASKCENSEGEYRGWDDSRKQVFRRKLTGHIKQHLNCGTYHVIDSGLYESEISKYPTNRRLSAYEYCLVQCVASIIWEKTGNPDIETVSLFIEQGQKVRPGLRKMLDSSVGADNIIEEIVYANKSKHIPFQVADFIAYEVFRRHEDLKTGADLMRRQALIELFDNLRVTGFYSSPEYLVKALQFNPELWKALES